METFAEVVRTRMEDDHEGLRFEGRSWTWNEVIRESAARASLLRTFVPGDGRTQRHVGILLQNVPDYVFWLLGAALNGDVVVGINPTRRGAELAHDVRHADCDLVVSEPLYADDVQGLDLSIPPERVLDVESAAYAHLLARHQGAEPPSELPDPAAIFLLLFSSGSTGAPKAVICSQGRLGRLTEKMAERIAVRRDSVNYMCLPLFHGHAIMMTMATAAQVGATVVMVRKFSASRFIPDIREHKVTFFNYVGRVLSYILSQPEQPSDRNNSLQVVFGSEASPAEVRAFRERFDCPDVREGYGASEGVIRIVPVPGAPDSSLGLPAAEVEAQIRDPETGEECVRALFDEDGALLNAEEATGEIVAMGRGASFEGYYKNPGAMADRLKFGGEDFWTGDLGYRDEAGYFYFGGRPADWLRVDGENFGAAPVERILVRFAAFAGAHCFGVPDPKTGDLLTAVVTLKDGHEFDPGRFAQFLAEQPDLGSKWRPTFVRVIDAVPTTANGKIDKAPLRAQAWEADDVWYAQSWTSPYLPLTDDQREAIRRAFIDSGRENALPAASRAGPVTAGHG